MRAEYDRTNNRIVAIEQDNGRVSTTNSPRVLGSKTEWLPVSVVYPEGYDERFMNLLQAQSVEYAYDAAQNIVVVKYPDADFSPAALRQALVDSVKMTTQNELAKTDWAVIRSIETGDPVPKDVAAQRKAVREQSDQMEAKVKKAKDKDLSSIHITFGTVPTTEQSPPVEAVEGGDGSEWVTDATHPNAEGKPVHPVGQAPVVLPPEPENENQRPKGRR